MGSTRRRFTEEYKAQAVAFVIDDHRPIAEVARNIGVHAMTLGAPLLAVSRCAAASRNCLTTLSSSAVV
jgi:transposase